MSIDKARDALHLNHQWPLRVVMQIEDLAREAARDEFAKLSGSIDEEVACAPADMRKPEDGGTDELEQRLADATSRAQGHFEASLRAHKEWYDAEVALRAALATIAERDRRIAAAVKKMQWDLEHPEAIGHERGEIIAILTGEGPYEEFLDLDALLSGQQDTATETQE